MSEKKPVLQIDQKLLDHWNKELQGQEPLEILKWSITTFPGLYQTTAFGLTGTCIIDMLSTLAVGADGQSPVELVFVDTLYHFPQTLELVERIEKRYRQFKLHVYRPEGCASDAEFAARYGDNLWETDEMKYDYLVKVEPLKRAYEELRIMAVFTGRRQSQGAKRGALPIVELDAALGVVKINPLAEWSFADVQRYAEEHAVERNELLQLGYKSVGDWHSTQPVADGEDERSGRWSGRAKTECGIHVASQYQQYFGGAAAQ